MSEKIDVLIYGYITNVILSKDLFGNNIDIKKFLENETSLFLKEEEQFKDYVYKTRTLILARTIRITEKRDDKKQIYQEFLKEYKKISKIEQSEFKATNKNRKKKNKFNDLLDQFER